MSGISARAPSNGRRHWRCNPRRPAIRLDTGAYCPTCGRLISERFKVRSDHFGAKYVRRHVGMWSTYGGC